MQPKKGYSYTLRQVLQELNLEDTPHLSFTKGVDQVIQNSHVTYDDLLLVPGFALTLWTYKRTTDESIPIFTWSEENAEPIEKFVDMVDLIDPFVERKGVLWVTPKGHPREQYYRIETCDGEAFITDDSDSRYDLPTFDEHGRSECFYTRINNPGKCDKCKENVDKRHNYRDPSEGNCTLYEVCYACFDRATNELG